MVSVRARIAQRQSEEAGGGRRAQALARRGESAAGGAGRATAAARPRLALRRARAGQMHERLLYPYEPSFSPVSLSLSLSLPSIRQYRHLS